jgi:hypothetical protein
LGGAAAGFAVAAGLAGAAGFAGAGFGGAAAASPLEPSTFRASASSTLEAATLASIPAALSLASSSLLVSPFALAISWTRLRATY